MRPWEYSAPSFLYKYLPPDRFHVLNDCRVRFSQRSVFKDDHELQPDYASFGTESEIWRYVLSIGFKLDPKLPANVLVKLLAESPKHQKTAVDSLQQSITVRDELGVFCLTEAADSDQMWAEYAGNGKGFVIGFDPNHARFWAIKGARSSREGFVQRPANWERPRDYS
jgi:hypothetical protein